MLCTRADPEGRLRRSPSPLKSTKLTLLTKIFCYLANNSIPDIRQFCRPLFCHSSVVKYTSSLIQWWTHNEAWLPNITEIVPPNLTGWIFPCFTRRTFDNFGFSATCFFAVAASVSILRCFAYGKISIFVFSMIWLVMSRCFLLHHLIPTFLQGTFCFPVES